MIKKIYLLGIFWVGFCILYAQQNDIDKADYLTTLEKNVVREINLARQSPKKYAAFIEQITKYYVGKQIKRPGRTPVITTEGVSAAKEAIRFLNRVKPAFPLRISKGMSLGAKDHVVDQGTTGATGHKGRDGSQVWNRVNRYGTCQRVVAENISYGRDKARDIVMGLIIDDGVPDRGHRKNFFNRDFNVVGVAYGYHVTYGSMCVITFAGEYKDRKGFIKY